MHIGHLREGRAARGREGDGRSSTRRAATASAVPTRPRTSCTTPCRRTSARTPSSKARRSTTTGCGSTSRTSAPSTREQLAAIEHDVDERVAAGEPVKWRNAAAGRGPQAGRDDALRRKVSRPRADGVDGRVQQGTVRRHAPGQHRRGRAFEILSEEGVSAGTRRIVALTGARRPSIARRSQASCTTAAKRLGVGAARRARRGARARRAAARVEAGARSGRASRNAPTPTAPSRQARGAPSAEASEGGARRSGAAAVRGAAGGRRAHRRDAGRGRRRSRSGSPSAKPPARCRPTPCSRRPNEHGGVTVVARRAAGRRAEPDAAAHRPDPAEDAAVGRAAGHPAGDDKVTLVAGVSKQLQAAA